METVFDPIRLQEIEREQFLSRRHGERLVLLRRELCHAVPGLTGDRHACAAARDDLADLLEKHRRAVEVDLQDGFDACLAGREPRAVDEHLDLSVFLCLFDEGADGGAVGEIHLHRLRIKARVHHNPHDIVRVLPALIAHDDLHLIAHAARNRHAQLTGSRHNHNVFHMFSPFPMIDSKRHRFIFQVRAYRKT